MKNNKFLFEEEVKRIDKKNQQFSDDVMKKYNFTKELIGDTKSHLQTQIAESCSIVKEFCRSNTLEVTNNATELSDTVHETNIDLDTKIAVNEKELERIHADLQDNIHRSVGELTESLQNLRDTIKVEELNRDKRNNILIHGVAVQEGKFLICLPSRLCGSN